MTEEKTYSTTANTTVTVVANVPRGLWGVPATALLRLAVLFGLELEVQDIKFEEPLMAVVDRLAAEVLIEETKG